MNNADGKFSTNRPVRGEELLSAFAATFRARLWLPLALAIVAPLSLLATGEAETRTTAETTLAYTDIGSRLAPLGVAPLITPNRNDLLAPAILEELAEQTERSIGDLRKDFAVDERPEKDQIRLRVFGSSGDKTTLLVGAWAAAAVEARDDELRARFDATRRRLVSELENASASALRRDLSLQLQRLDEARDHVRADLTRTDHARIVSTRTHAALIGLTVLGGALFGFFAAVVLDLVAGSLRTFDAAQRAFGIEPLGTSPVEFERDAREVAADLALRLGASHGEEPPRFVVLLPAHDGIEAAEIAALFQSGFQAVFARTGLVVSAEETPLAAMGSAISDWKKSEQVFIALWPSALSDGAGLLAVGRADLVVVTAQIGRVRGRDARGVARALELAGAVQARLLLLSRS